MKIKMFLKYWSMIFGVTITSLLLLAVAPKIIGIIIEEGFTYLMDIPKAFATWSDPKAFFFTYLIGYAVIWWKPLWGSIIIIIVSTFYVVISDNWGPLIFAIPTFLVGFFYLLYWILARKNNINDA